MSYDLASSYAAEILTQESEGQRVYEAVVGMVTDNKDPQKLGRVKVKYPMLSQNDSSWWAPIVMMGAGKNRGWFFIPEIDDEVLVLFEHGHLDRPIVVGAMWNGKDKPADKNPGGNPRRVIKSRGGSKIELDDEKGKITIEDGAGKGKIEFDAEAKKIIITAKEGDVCLQTPKGDMVIVSASTEITAGGNLEIHAGKEMQWGSDASITIKSSSCTLAGAKVNLNCGSAQMPQAPTANPQDIADPYEGRRSPQNASEQPAPTSDMPPSPPQSPTPPDQQPQEAAPEPEQTEPEPEPDPENVHVISMEMKSPGGEPLAFEDVIVVKKGTNEKVAGPVMTDETGHVAILVDKEGDYELQIVDDTRHLDIAPTEDSEVEFKLACTFEDDGIAVAGETVKVSGPGYSGSVTLDGDGHFDMPVGAGDYELTIKGQTFHAVAVRSSDSGGASRFQVDNKLDKSADFEKARANRMSPKK